MVTSCKIHGPEFCARALVFVLAGGLAPLGAIAQTAPGPQYDAQAADITEIVVTANKKSEKIKDIPAKIDVVTPQQIENLGITDFQDYASLVPNLNQSNGRGAGQGNVVLRGLFTGSLQNSATTAVYVDEAAFTPDASLGLGATGTIDPDLFGGTQIEVLKGPQGTLYGASSLGGIVRIKPAQPDPAVLGLHGSATIGGDFAAGGENGYTAKGAFDYTIVPDKLAIGGSAFNRVDPGFIKDVGTGATDLGKVNAHGFSASAVLIPTDDLKIRGFYFEQVDHTTGYDVQQNLLGTGTPTYGDREGKFQVPQYSALTARLYEFVADYKTPIGTASLIYTNARLVDTTTQDYSESYGNYLFGPQGALAGLLGVFGLPSYAGAGIGAITKPQTFLQNEELRFNSDRLDDFQFQLGFYHSAESTNTFQGLTDYLPGTTSPLPTVFGFDFANGLTVDFASEFDELAGYGNIKYYINDEVDIEGGVRYTYDSQAVIGPEYGILTGFQTLNLNQSFGEHAWLYSASLSWHPGPTLNGYLHSASGFRPGGANASPFAAAAGFPSFGSDMVYDYEGGFKGTLFDNRLTYDVSGYYINWENVQLSSTIGGLLVLLNSAGGADIYGTELTLQYRAGNGLSFGGSFGYNATSLGPVPASVTATSGAKEGDPLPGSPTYTLAAYGDYNFVLSDDITGDVGATIRYQGEKNSSYPAAGTDINYVIPSYTTLDLRASLNYGDFTLRGAVTNVTNENGYTGYTTLRVVPSQNVSSYAYLIRPREFKISLSYDF